MTTTLLAGILVAFIATTFAAANRRAPTHARCPACGAATESVQAPEWMRRSVPDLLVRWCPACSWEGIGRVDATFEWGTERLPADFGFRFATPAESETSAEPPHHPSGFRFAAPEAVPGPPERAHPSGFTWAASAEPPAGQGAAAPPATGFRWAEAGRAGPLFQWRERRGPPPSGGDRGEGVA